MPNQEALKASAAPVPSPVGARYVDTQPSMLATQRILIAQPNGNTPAPRCPEPSRRGIQGLRPRRQDRNTCGLASRHFR